MLRPSPNDGTLSLPNDDDDDDDDDDDGPLKALSTSPQGELGRVERTKITKSLKRWQTGT